MWPPPREQQDVFDPTAPSFHKNMMMTRRAHLCITESEQKGGLPAEVLPRLSISPSPHSPLCPFFLGNMGSSRPATAPAATRRQQLLILLIGLLVVLSPHCVGAKLFKRRDKNAPAQTIESTPESSDDDAPPAAAVEETAVATETAAEQVCDEMLARSLVKANDDKAAAIAERDEALTKVTAGEVKVAELEQVSRHFCGTICAIFAFLPM